VSGTPSALHVTMTLAALIVVFVVVAETSGGSKNGNCYYIIFSTLYLNSMFHWYSYQVIV
jgi:hypothetical protein